ncbi:glycoside hydrolase family 13 protein [Vibrio astriarenae]
MGDLNGVTSKLDYLKDLGIDLIWICPIFASPNDDNGYDISDYQDIMADFGTMKDFDNLLAETHKRGMKLILDLVPNHTSDEHAWFKESRSSRDNPKRDWYIWKDKEEINNWESIFKSSVWEHDALTDQYYLHLFSKKQPDLNWENPEVREAMFSMINWWLDKGIDGFRIDAISVMKKKPGMPDQPNPDNLENVPAFEEMLNVDGILDYVDELCERTFNPNGAVTVGEASGVNPESAKQWVGEEHNRLNMIFQFEHIALWQDGEKMKLDLVAMKQVFKNWQTGLDGVGWNSLFVENHDMPRIVSKWGDEGEYWRQSATSIATMYFLMQGTPFIYQGQEISMTNTVYNKVEDFDCVLIKNQCKELAEQGWTEEQIVNKLKFHTRDNSRTPMQWNATKETGFSSVTSWMPVNPNYPTINVAQQQQDPNSILNFYKKLIQVRKQHQALIYGDFELLFEEHEDLFVYARNHNGERYIVISSFTDKDIEIDLQSIVPVGSKLLLSNYDCSAAKNTIRPFEARVIKVQ